MSSHREAPAISKDPVADSTDLYAFRSPDSPDTVTIIANYLPLQLPAGRRSDQKGTTTNFGHLASTLQTTVAADVLGS